ncbi:hypothetical protein D3C80_1480210 [compost metagenome]
MANAAILADDESAGHRQAEVVAFVQCLEVGAECLVHRLQRWLQLEDDAVLARQLVARVA